MDDDERNGDLGLELMIESDGSVANPALAAPIWPRDCRALHGGDGSTSCQDSDLCCLPNHGDGLPICSRIEWQGSWTVTPAPYAQDF